MISQTRILTLVKNAYEAAENEEAWPALLTNLGDLFGGAACGITIHRPISRSTQMATSVRLNPEDAREYAAYYHRIDLFTSLGSAALSKATVAASHTYLEDSVLAKSEYFNDFLRRQNLFYNMVCGLHCTTGSSAYLTVLRSQSAGKFDKSENAVLELLAPYLRHAAHLHQRLNSSCFVDPALQLSRRAYLLVDASCNIVFANGAALKILKEHDGVSRGNDGLRLNSKAQNRDLASLCAAAADPIPKAGTSSVELMAAIRPSGKRSYLLKISPLRASNLAKLLGAATAVIAIVDPEEVAGFNPDCLKILFGLTPTETQVAVMLINGDDVSEVSGKLSISRNTARTHLRHIFEKTGVRRQAELVSLASRL